MPKEDRRPTILIVEDEALIRMLSADVLLDAGFDVLEAGDADEAVALLQDANQVEVMFTDVRMPGRMDGLQLAALVHQRWPAIGLLVTSGHCYLSPSELPDDGYFVSKPYHIDDVVTQICGSAPKAGPRPRRCNYLRCLESVNYARVRIGAVGPRRRISSNVNRCLSQHLRGPAFGADPQAEVHARRDWRGRSWTVVDLRRRIGRSCSAKGDRIRQVGGGAMDPGI